MATKTFPQYIADTDYTDGATVAGGTTCRTEDIAPADDAEQHTTGAPDAATEETAARAEDAATAGAPTTAAGKRTTYMKIAASE